MITTSDIADILYRDCQQFGISAIYRKGNVPEVTGGKLTAERIVILPKPQQPGKQWLKDFVEVNLCVPDLDDKGTADLGRLQELERMAKPTLDHKTGMFDGILRSVDKKTGHFSDLVRPFSLDFDAKVPFEADGCGDLPQ